MGDQPINNVVNVTISRESRGVTQAGFGTPLVITDETPQSSWSTERVREYSDIDEVAEDWATSDDAYVAAQRIFGQVPKVESMKIGLEATRVAQVMTIVFSADLVTSNIISAFTISFGTLLETVTATNFNASNSQTLTDLATKIQATAAITTAVSDGVHTITCTSAKAGVSFSISAITVTGGASQATVARTNTVANHGIADDISECSEEDDDWYGLIWNERDEDHVATAAAAIEARRKIFVSCSQDADILSGSDSDDIASVLSLATYDRTAIIYNADAGDFADAALIGKCFPFQPGSETWMFKTLNGITRDDLTSSKRSAALDKNANIYVTTAGVNFTEKGTMASGEYIDIIRGADWLQARLEERIFSRLVNLSKVPYTDDGIAIIEGEIRAVLDSAIKAGVLSGDALPDNGPNDYRPYRLSVPKAAEVSPNDRADRLLPDVTFIARFAGAIHKVNILGRISV